MTAVDAAQLGLGWLALGATVTSMLSHRASRWSWSAAALLASASLAVTQSVFLAAILAIGTLAALAAEGPERDIEPDFARLTRHLSLTLAALAGAVVVLVRLAHVDAQLAPRVFPLLATGIVALVALFAAAEQAEIHRAARLLLVMVAVGWTIATLGSEPAAVVATAATLPLLGLTARLRDQPADQAAP